MACPCDTVIACIRTAALKPAAGELRTDHGSSCMGATPANSFGKLLCFRLGCQLPVHKEFQMRTIWALPVMAAVLWFPALGQSPPLIPTEDPGVARSPLMARPEIRVTRVELQSGATRRVHAHTDVQYHVLSVLTGEIQLVLEAQPPADAAPGRTFFFTPGTRHGFKNVGKTPAAVMEIFVVQGAVSQSSTAPPVPNSGKSGAGPAR